MAYATTNPPHQETGDSSNIAPLESPDEHLAAGRFARLISHLSTVVVVLLLAGVGLYGHHSGWKLPKFSALIGNGITENKDWCEEHAVPESQCVECHPDLLPRGKDYGWCKEHGVANCPWCHPEVAQLKQTVVIGEADRRRAARALALVVRSENNPSCKNYQRRIQFASLDAMKKAGVDVALVDRQPLVETISANGQITYDQTRFASLSSRLPGTVWQVERNAGDQVHAGEILALVDAAEVGRAKTDLVQARAHEQLQRSVVERLKSITDIISGGKLQEAQAELVQAQTRLLSVQQTLVNYGLPIDIEQLRILPQAELTRHLQFLGIPQTLAERLDCGTATSSLLPLKAPLEGVIVARQVVAGEVVDTTRVLFQVADTSRMWLTLNVSEEDAGKLSLGQSVRFRPDGTREEATGKLVWISTTVDPQTRTVAARAELSNPKGQLRNETFGAGTIVLREEPETIVVPRAAVHWEGDCHVVFVRDRGFFDSPQSPNVFHVRTVRLGAELAAGGFAGEKVTEIIAGLLPGEVVAAKGSDVLRAELLKNNLGEGCCCCGGGKK